MGEAEGRDAVDEDDLVDHAIVDVEADDGVEDDDLVDHTIVDADGVDDDCMLDSANSKTNSRNPVADSRRAMVNASGVKAYWPDDDVWLPARVVTVLPGGDVRIRWLADGTQSVVPGDYVEWPSGCRKK